MKKLTEIINEQYGQSHLRKQGSELGKLVKNINELKKNIDYCIVDFGLGEWNGGYRFTGIENGEYKFKDTISPHGDKYNESFTKEELLDFIKNKAIAFDSYGDVGRGV